MVDVKDTTTTPRFRPLDELTREPGPTSSPPDAAGTVDTVERNRPAPAPKWTFRALTFPDYYDASQEVGKTYNIPKVLTDIPSIWNAKYSDDIDDKFRDEFRRLGGRENETYGQLFRRVGQEIGVDPYALATYCIFESYNSETGSFNPHMKESGGGMLAAGIAATQAQHTRGKPVPGLDRSLPVAKAAAARHLRASPELGVRFLAQEMKTAYRNRGQDLALALPRVAHPAWNDPDSSKGAYGTQAEYVSRAYSIYKAFADTDRFPGRPTTLDRTPDLIA